MPRKSEIYDGAAEFGELVHYFLAALTILPHKRIPLMNSAHFRLELLEPGIAIVLK